MKNNGEEIAYFSRIDREKESIYIAATEQGLCFVGSQNKGINEMISWFEKYRPNVKLVENWDKVATYADELGEYLNEERKDFHLSIDLIGTAFQEAVWAELKNIPYGKTKTYTDIAESIGRPGSARAVGTAIGANPVLIVVPCHRVISKSGKLAGYRGGISMKEKLLELESNLAPL